MGSYQLSVGSRQLAVGSWQLAVGSWQLAGEGSGQGAIQFVLLTTGQTKVSGVFVDSIRVDWRRSRAGMGEKAVFSWQLAFCC